MADRTGNRGGTERRSGLRDGGRKEASDDVGLKRLDTGIDNVGGAPISHHIPTGHKVLSI